jgi:hypothetical protein
MTRCKVAGVVMNSLTRLSAQSGAIQRTPRVMWQFAMAVAQRCRGRSLGLRRYTRRARHAGEHQRPRASAALSEAEAARRARATSLFTLSRSRASSTQANTTRTTRSAIRTSRSEPVALTSTYQVEGYRPRARHVVASAPKRMSRLVSRYRDNMQRTPTHPCVSMAKLRSASHNATRFASDESGRMDWHPPC